MDTPEQTDRDDLYDWGHDREEVAEYYESERLSKEAANKRNLKMDKKKVREGLDLLKSNGAFAAMNMDAIKLIEEALAPKPTLYLGQQVLVSDDEKYWVPRILKDIDNPIVDKYEVETLNDREFTNYEYCKPDPEAVTRPVWIEHDGSSECPVGERARVFTEFLNGGFCSSKASKVFWEHVTRWFIVPEYNSF